MNTFIEKLAEACREHRVPEKWLIAPSLRVGHQWLDQVTRSGGPVLNVHVLTVRSLAARHERRRLPRHGAAHTGSA